MAHLLKTTGIAVSMVLTMSVITASVASAQGQLKSDGPVTLDMALSGGPGNDTTMFGERVECPGATYRGHRYNETPHLLIPSGATTVTLTPIYNQPCISESGGQATVLMNGCDYVLHIGATTGGKLNTYGVTTDLVCPVGKHVQLELFSGAKHEAAARTCTRTLKPQTGIVGAHLTATPEFNLYLSGTFKNIHVEQSGACGTATTLSAEFHVDTTVKGTSSIGANTFITLSHGESGIGLLTAEGPVTLIATSFGSSNALTAFGMRAKCPGGMHTGHKVGSTTEPIASGSTTATITPQYEQPCPASGNRQATVEMNGCDYVAHIGGEVSAATFAVTTDIVCPEGKLIFFSIWNTGVAHEAALRNCTIAIPAQTGLSGAHLTSTSAFDDLDFSGTFANVKAVRSGTCLGDGKGIATTEGKIDVNATVTGTDAEGKATGITVG